jgi:hypothetical protein
MAILAVVAIVFIFQKKYLPFLKKVPMFRADSVFATKHLCNLGKTTRLLI